MALGGRFGLDDLADTFWSERSSALYHPLHPITRH
jgi:hypothetical protein